MSSTAEFKVNVSRHDWYRVLSSFPGAEADSSVIMFVEHVGIQNPAIFRLRARKGVTSDITTKVRGINVSAVNAADARVKVEDDVQITHIDMDVVQDNSPPSASFTVHVVDASLRDILRQSNSQIAMHSQQLVNMFTDGYLQAATASLGLNQGLTRSNLRLITRKITEIEFELKRVSEKLGASDMKLTHWRWGDDFDQETFEISWKGKSNTDDGKLEELRAFKEWLREMDVVPSHSLSKTSTFS